MVYESRTEVVSLAGITLIMSSVYAVWIRERIPTKREQLRAMTVSDYLVFFGHVFGAIFVFGCAITTIFGLTDIRACTFAGASCIVAVAGSKIAAILLVNEKMRQISTKSTMNPRTKDRGYIIHVACFFCMTCGFAGWLLSTFDPKVTGDVCRFRWGVSAFFSVLLYVSACELYLTIRCSWTLIRTKHDVMRSWAYRLILGCAVCVGATISNLAYLAVMKARMESFGCLRSCLLDVFFTSLAVHYLLQPKPLYKAMDDLPVNSTVDFERGSPTGEVPAPSVFSRIAPSYRTRATGDSKSFGFRASSIKDKGSRVSVALVSGATPDGISAYLSQVSEESPVITSAKQKPRHVSLLPSHPSFSSYARPRPIYSCYPNYSLENIESIQDDFETVAVSPYLRGAPGTEIPIQEPPHDNGRHTRERADLYGCESDQEHDHEELAFGHVETSLSTDTRGSGSGKRRNSGVRFLNGT